MSVSQLICFDIDRADRSHTAAVVQSSCRWNSSHWKKWESVFYPGSLQLACHSVKKTEWRCCKSGEEQGDGLVVCVAACVRACVCVLQASHKFLFTVISLRLSAGVLTQLQNGHMRHPFISAGNKSLILECHSCTCSLLSGGFFLFVLLFSSFPTFKRGQWKRSWSRQAAM